MSSKYPQPSIDAKEQFRRRIYDNRITIAASISSFASTLVGFPLDSIKSRLQVKRYASVLDCFKKTISEEGIAGLFRGVVIPLCTVTIVRTTSISIYDHTKKLLRSNGYFNNESSLWNKAALGFCGGATSGIMISVGSCPFELVKIRAQLEYLIAAKQGRPYNPIGTLSGAKLLWNEAGLRGLYYGGFLHTFRDTAGTGLYFAGYDVLRSAVKDELPGPLAPFVCGASAGIMSWTLIYPCDVVKTRVQRDALAGIQPREHASQIFKRLASRGIHRLYSGIGISVCRSCITHGLTWVIIEDITNRIKRNFEPKD